MNWAASWANPSSPVDVDALTPARAAMSLTSRRGSSRSTSWSTAHIRPAERTLAVTTYRNRRTCRVSSSARYTATKSASPIHSERAVQQPLHGRRQEVEEPDEVLLEAEDRVLEADSDTDHDEADGGVDDQTEQVPRRAPVAPGDLLAQRARPGDALATPAVVGPSLAGLLRRGGHAAATVRGAGGTHCGPTGRPPGGPETAGARP